MKNKFMTFALFLAAKSISEEIFQSKTQEEKVDLYKEHSEGQEEFIKSLIDEGTLSKEQIEKMQKDLETTREREMKALNEVISKQGLAITKMLEHMKGRGQCLDQGECG
jgi:molecular chaperone DnaK (HSP70)